MPEGEGAEAEGTGDGQINGYEGMNGTGHGQDQEMANGEAQVQQEEPSASAAGLRGERQPNKVRITTPYLTKYERARVLGTRALQIR